MVDEEILDAGLFNISLAAVSDTEEDGGHHDGVGGGGTTNHNSNNTKTAEEKKNHRTGQTEEQFQAVRRSYRAKVENGEIGKSIRRRQQLPLGGRKVPKHEAQELLHAVEELYFFKRYDEGAALVGSMFGHGGEGRVDRDTRELLRTYERKCCQKLADKSVTAA